LLGAVHSYLLGAANFVRSRQSGSQYLHISGPGQSGSLGCTKDGQNPSTVLLLLLAWYPLGAANFVRNVST
jgi:hypothetical protein